MLVQKLMKICTQIWAKRWIFWFLNSNYLSKSNLNYINCKDYEGITLLTWLGFKLHGLKSISPVSSSTCVRCSRGNSDQFSQWFVINPASIWSQLSLERKGVMKNLRFFLQKCLISSRFNQKLSLQRERTSIYTDFIAKIAVRLICWWNFGWLWSRIISGPWSHDADSTPLDFVRPIFIGV